MNREAEKIVNLPLREVNLANGGGGSHDDGMEHRVTALETRLDTILPTLATRGDMHQIDASIKGWMIATIIALFIGFAGLFFTVTSSIRRSDAPAVQPTAPLIIQVPYPAQPPAAQQQPAPLPTKK